MKNKALSWLQHNFPVPIPRSTFLKHHFVFDYYANVNPITCSHVTLVSLQLKVCLYFFYQP